MFFKLLLVVKGFEYTFVTTHSLRDIIIVFNPIAYKSDRWNFFCP